MHFLISKQIKELRKKHNLSQNRFGMRIGVTGKSVSAYETGKGTPSLRVLESISKVYDVSIAELDEVSGKKIEDHFKKLQNSLEDLKNVLNVKD